MLTVITPAQFKKIPWKNGKGTTTELAISENSTLDDFSWRLSIASVVTNGAFSDFSGYWRNLVLISGEGITLQHTLNNETHTDNLTELLQVSSFDGASKTRGELVGGSINDFNVMTNTKNYKAEVSTYTNKEQIKVKACDHCFVYSLSNEVTLFNSRQEIQILPSEHLLKITAPTVDNFSVTGEMMIVVYLFEN